MQSFLHRHSAEIKGVLSSWDRLASRGTLRWLSSLAGLSSYLVTNGILLKGFGSRAESITEQARGFM
jgi:hypothetical protein